MKELIGKECAIVFNLPDEDWPIHGYPAWATVEAVDMPMIKLDDLWVNVSIIKTIKEY